MKKEFKEERKLKVKKKKNGSQAKAVSFLFYMVTSAIFQTLSRP